MGKKKYKARKPERTVPISPAPAPAPHQEGVQKDDEAYSGTPYNFVSLWMNVHQRYDSHKDLPCHDELTPGLLSGTIRCTFTAQTPVSVSDGAEDFFRDAEGRYVLPGSTVKGLVRTNMMILGFGALRPGEDFDDIPMLYRAMADAKTSVKADLMGDYQAALQCKGQPPRVSACYVRREGKEYQIYRSGDYLRVKRKIVPPERKGRGKATEPNPVLEKLMEKDHSEDWYTNDTTEREVWYKTNGMRVSQLLYRESGESSPGSDFHAGILLSPGKMHGQNTLYLFPAFDAQAEHFQWHKEDRLAYEMDYKMRENSLGGTDQSSGDTKKRRKMFWKLPEQNGEVKPFFLLGEWEEAAGALEEAAEDSFERRDQVVIGRTPYLRLGFRHTPSHGLPSQHRNAARTLVLDYPNALLGFCSKVNEGGEKENLSYRSRVAFEDFRANSKKTRTVHRILAGPKPTSFPDYLENGKHYNDNDFRLRGIKQYWLHEVNNVVSDKENVASTLTTLPVGTRFSGRIRFHNLHRDELGLLLWCLRLDEGCYQTVGMGKPYGFGRMSVTLDSVEQLCPEYLYSPGSLTGVRTKALDVDALLSDYEAHIQSWLSTPGGKGGKETKRKAGKNISLREQNSIADFLYLHSEIQDEKSVRYMKLEEYSNRSKRLPTVREKREELAAAQASLSKEEEYRHRKAECGDLRALFALIQEFKANGWPIPED